MHLIVYHNLNKKEWSVHVTLPTWEEKLDVIINILFAEFLKTSFFYTFSWNLIENLLENYMNSQNEFVDIK